MVFQSMRVLDFSNLEDKIAEAAELNMFLLGSALFPILSSSLGVAIPNY
jgi:hypothetical protein